VRPIVVMGISGSGKSTVGADLALSLGVPYADGDDFHSAANVAKMSAGRPLTDADRLPWLRAVADWLAEHEVTGGVVSCSALRRRYRDILRSGAPDVVFVHLDGDPGLARQRSAGRRSHFMPPGLVTSQEATLEPLEPDENGMVIDFDQPADAMVQAALDRLPG
jgi:gluconokinase